MSSSSLKNDVVPTVVGIPPSFDETSGVSNSGGGLQDVSVL